MFMAKKRRKKTSAYHIVVIPEDSSQVHRFQMRSWAFRGLVLVLMGLCLGLIVTTGGYVRYQKLYRNTVDMRSRLADLHDDQSRMVQELSELADSVGRSENLANKISSLLGPTQDKTAEAPSTEVEHDKVLEQDTLSTLGQLDPVSMVDRMDGLADGLLVRALSVEKNITEIYQDFQNQQVRRSSYPDIWPVDGWLTSEFGMRRSPINHQISFHEGLDIAASWGSDVIATGDGVVRFAAYKGGLGYTIIIDHGFGLETSYGHNSRLLAKVGDKVRRGQVIAAAGNSGQSTGPHVHYEVHVDGVPVDPLNFLPSPDAEQQSAYRSVSF
jgi:murein DD-endopeptidase MepM/ murein hydrolase activator NlpD